MKNVSSEVLSTSKNGEDTIIINGKTYTPEIIIENEETIKKLEQKLDLATNWIENLQLDNLDSSKTNFENEDNSTTSIRESS